MNTQCTFLTPQQSEHPYTISEINSKIADIIESGNTVIWVEGEISNWKPSTSGHCYFRMKDMDSQIPAVIWRSTAQQLKCKIENGMAVIVIASIRVYKKGGYYQLDVHKIQPIGSGALSVAFEKLKKRLKNEGLFDHQFKKNLPESITRIGVITSKRGAALRDIIRVTNSRSPQVDIILVDVLVQGDKAANEIAAAIDTINQYNNIDVIIVGRGGGTIEDLWAFNEEVVARSIFKSKIPVISAVGHEIDFTIADFVADVRAPTPSAAAEIAVADDKERSRFFLSLAEHFSYASKKYFLSIVQNYATLKNSAALKKPFRQYLENRQYIDELESQFRGRIVQILKNFQSRLKMAGAKLNALSPLGVLSRGYSVVLDNNNQVIRKSTDVQIGDMINIKLFQGSLNANITATQHTKGDIDV